jgi:hypothetical protein
MKLATDQDSKKIIAARQMLEQTKELPASVTADKSYGTADNRDVSCGVVPPALRYHRNGFNDNH